jgi:hypothetical protein
MMMETDMSSEDAFLNYDEENRKPKPSTKAAGGNGSTAAELADVALSDAELSALGNAGRDLMPIDTFLVGRPLKWLYETGRWCVEVYVDKNKNLVDVDANDEFLVDLRSYTEVWKRWENSKVTHQLGGRPIDGCINVVRDQLPDRDRSKWPLGDKGAQDPWRESYQITLVRVRDDQFLTWAAQYSGTRGLSEFLDTAVKEAKAHPGKMPVVQLTTVTRPGSKQLVPKLVILRWEPFGEGAAPPSNPKAAERTREQLRLIQEELAPKKAGAKKGGGRVSDFDDQAPF